MRLFNLFYVAVLFMLFSSFAPPVFASHSWGTYHWARTTSPFTLNVGDNLTGAWKPYLQTTATDWSASTVLDINVITGLANKSCSPINGRVEVCNRKYGNNGWLGVASIWITDGDHIYQGTTKVNDTYFGTPSYNTPEWKNLVMCQEVGHTLGLNHQDENFNNANLNTCMDYAANPSSNQHPNAHDYEQFESIYAHLDPIVTLLYGTPTKANHMSLDNPSDWGREVRRNGNVAEYMRGLDNGDFIVTHVIYAER